MWGFLRRTHRPFPQSLEGRRNFDPGHHLIARSLYKIRRNYWLERNIMTSDTIFSFRTWLNYLSRRIWWKYRLYMNIYSHQGSYCSSHYNRLKRCSFCRLEQGWNSCYRYNTFGAKRNPQESPYQFRWCRRRCRKLNRQETTLQVNHRYRHCLSAWSLSLYCTPPSSCICATEAKISSHSRMEYTLSYSSLNINHSRKVYIL